MSHALFDAGKLALGAVLNDPAMRSMLTRYAEELLRGDKAYRKYHWGSRGKGPVPYQDPGEPDRLVYMGALAGVRYVATKGGEQSDFFHDFDTPRPHLCVAEYDDGRRHSRELVIVRARSDFTVTAHGIEG